MSRLKEIRTTFRLLLFIAILGACTPCAEYTPESGDIIFHQSKSSQSPVIRIAQQSRWTHCGIIIILNGKPYVYEASKTVMCTPLQKWTARGKDGHFVVKRLKDDSILTESTLSKMKSAALGLKGRPYDFLFEWSDSKIYCSELVWKIYSRGAGVDLCELQKFGDLPLDNQIVSKLVEKRYPGKSLDVEDPIVTPAALYRSRLLRTVKRH